MSGIRRTRDGKLARLMGLPVFRGFSPDQLVALGRLAEEARFAAGQVLQAEGFPGWSWCVLERGSAAVSRAGLPTALFAPGDWWGEAALLSGQPAAVTVVALTPVTLFAFDRRAFLGVLGELPTISMALLRAMSGWEPSYAQAAGRPVSHPQPPAGAFRR